MTRTLPAILLAAIALHQIARVEWASLAPWKGGGFGMFATSDRSLTRRVRAYALAGSERARLGIPGDLANLRQRARALPDAARLERLARGLAATARERVPDATAVRVEVWRIGFSGELSLEGELLARRTLPLAAPGP
ncbi:MAG: hypothetical protein ACQGVK_06030 [Myxococcota bacterium]